MNIFLKNLWRWKCGLPELETEKMDIDKLRQSEWSLEFEELMRNRLVIGAMRYGRIQSENRPRYDRVSSMIKRLKRYSETGNKEFLVDVANLCLVEFVESKGHFHSIDDGEHLKIRS